MIRRANTSNHFLIVKIEDIADTAKDIVIRHECSDNLVFGSQRLSAGCADFLIVHPNLSITCHPKRGLNILALICYKYVTLSGFKHLDSYSRIEQARFQILNNPEVSGWNVYSKSNTRKLTPGGVKY